MSNNEFRYHEFEIMQEMWAKYKEYYANVDDSDEQWDRIVADFTEIYRKYKKTAFAMDLFYLFIHDLERRANERKLYEAQKQ